MPVPQLRGLKRRWAPVGSSGGARKLGVSEPKVGQEAHMGVIAGVGGQDGNEVENDMIDSPTKTSDKTKKKKKDKKRRKSKD